MKRVTWTRSSIADLNEIEEYLSQFHHSVAQDAIDRLIAAAEWLLDFPAAGAAFGYRRWRTWRPRTTRYILIYEPTRQGISIVRVRHALQDWRVVID